MGPSKIIFLLFCFLNAHLIAVDFETNRILFLINQGQIEEALDQYETLKQTKGKHDFALLQQISLLLLDQSFRTKEPEVQLMAIFAAGLASHDQAFYLLEEGLKSPFPEIQVVALNALGRTQNDLAFELMQRAMGSPHLLIRLEAAHQLAQKKHPRATAQVEALMQKVDPAVWPLFPQLFAAIGDDAALRILRKLMSHPHHMVRCASILSAAQFRRDDLLPLIRRLSLQPDTRQQEAAAYALGVFQDHASIDQLHNLSRSIHPNVQIAALQALYQLGEKKAAHSLINLAEAGDLFAISLLGNISGSEECLGRLAQNQDLQIRLNASLALLELRDLRCLPGIAEILVHDMRDLALTEIHSTGKALKAWKAVPSAAHRPDDAALLYTLSLNFREELLENTLTLPEKEFLRLATLLFDTKQNDLVPLLIELLVNLDTPAAIALLKKEQQKAGAPLIRNYATLALLKLREEGPYRELLKQWVSAQLDVEMMKFRAYVPFELRESESHFELTPQESARLLVESLELLAESDEQDGIELLLHVLRNGHTQNRPVIAALLLHFAT